MTDLRERGHSSDTVRFARLATAGIALALSVSSCRPSIDYTALRSYPCTGDAECPAGMRCGLDERCHLQGFPAPYRCATSDDCEGGWSCGLENLCHSPDVAADYLCTTAADCALGWRCGLEGRCHSRDVAAAYVCASDRDCELGWKCGLEGSCHAPDVGEPFACVDDGDCNVGWRCGFGGRCLDASADALRSAPFTSLHAERLSPAAPDGYPDLVSASYGIYPTTDRRVYATVRDGTLTHVELMPTPLRLSDGGELYAGRLDVPMPGRDVRAIWSQAERTMVLDDLGVLAVSWSLDGGVFERATDAGHSFNRVRNGVLFGATSMSAPPYTLPRADGGLQQLYDVGSWYGFLRLIAAEDGLFNLDGEPVVLPGLPNAQCPDAGTASGAHAVRVGLAALELRDENGAVQLMLPSSFPVAGCGAANRVVGQCAPCRPGDALVDWLGSHRGAIRAFCAPSDGGPQEDFLVGFTNDGGSCGRGEVFGVSRLTGDVERANQPVVDVSAHAGRHGQLHELDTLNSQTDTPHSLTLDRSTAVFYLRGGVPAAYVFEPYSDAQTPTHYRYQADVGLVRTNTQPWSFDHRFEVPLSAVDGHLSWARLGYPTQHYDVLLYDFSNPAGPVPIAQAAAVSAGSVVTLATADGGVSLLYSDRDQLRTTELARPLDDGGAGLLPLSELRLVPEPYVPILSLALVRGAPSPSGYALTANALHTFSGLPDAPWKSSVVPLPQRDWLEVWADEHRGRVGDSRGEVYALPSRVQIAPPLPEGQTVADFAAVCGATIALARGGLYELASNPDGGPVGVWRAEGLDGAISPALADRGLADGVLRRDGDTLYLVTGFGTVVRLRPQGGCR